MASDARDWHCRGRKPEGGAQGPGSGVRDETCAVSGSGPQISALIVTRDAVTPLEQASILDPKSARIQNNLELARAAIADHLPERRAGETDADFAARLNDAGVAAEERGDRARAIAAFSQALSVKDSWYARAANNLQEAQTQ